MARDWYYAQNGRQHGPVSEQQVRQMAASGQLQPEDLVWYEGLADWVAAAAVPGLIPPERLPPARQAVAPPMEVASSPVQEPRGLDTQRSQETTPQDRRRTPEAAPVESSAALDIPPLLALILAVGTLGIFSIWYTWRVSVHYARSSGARTTDAQGRTLGRVRHPAFVLAMSYLTLGAYFCYWVYRTMRECAVYIGQPSQPRRELTLMMAFPPYAVYSVVFKLPGLIHEARQIAGVDSGSVTGATNGDVQPLYSFLNPLMFPALPFLAVMYQDKLNEAWRA
jgi:hypothetical protein